MVCVWFVGPAMGVGRMVEPVLLPASVGLALGVIVGVTALRTWKWFSPRKCILGFSLAKAGTTAAEMAKKTSENCIIVGVYC